MNDLMTKSFTSYVNLKKEAMKDLEAGPDVHLHMKKTVNTMDHDLGFFLQAAGNVKKQIGSIQEVLDRLQELKEKSKSMHKPEALETLRKTFNDDIVTVLEKAKNIKVQLEEMDRGTTDNRRFSDVKEGISTQRTRVAVSNGLRKKLNEIMMDFQVLRQKLMAEGKETIERRYLTVTGQRPDEEMIEKIISDGSGGEEFLKRAIQEHGKGEVLDTVEVIRGRNDAVKEIEKSLLDLHQVFLDMAVMVETQGEQFDNIEHHVVNASNYVKDGTRELKTAKNFKKRSRKWMCFGTIFLLLIALVIIISIATSMSHS